MKRTVFPCYAPADREFAAGLAAFLECGADVRVFLEEGVIGPGDDLVSKAREGRMADIVVVVLSPDSVLAKWVRADWEEAFITGPAKERVRIAFLLRAECRFPAILRRDTFFHDGRALKRWIRDPAQSTRPAPPHIEALVAALADRPGTATSAMASEFVQHCAGDFDAVLWVRCGDRTPAQLAGDLGWQLGLRLDGEPLANAARIRAFCEDRRFLVVLEDARTPAAMELMCGGKTSTLLTETPVREYDPAGLPAIQHAFAQALPDDWSAACSLARRGSSLAREQDRLAEVFEMMEALYRSAKLRGDRRVVEEAAREQIWILEHWDRLEAADPLRHELGVHHARQLAFEF